MLVTDEVSSVIDCRCVQLEKALVMSVTDGVSSVIDCRPEQSEKA